jgi:hypothetical protein
MAPKDKWKITPKHFIGFSEVAGGHATISVYGRVVKNTELQPGESGILHPSGAGTPLQLAHVVGYSDQGRCVTLAEPQLVALPVPDGPADSCGWDSNQYVVWKNLPKNWATLHLKASTRSLHSVLKLAAPGVESEAAAPIKPCLDLPAAIALVRSCSKASPDLPLSTQLGQLFTSPTQRNSFCQCVADGVPIDRSQIPSGATNSLQDVVDAIAC